MLPLSIRRAAFLASAMAALAAPVVAADVPLTTLRVGGSPDPDGVALIWGQRNGIFKKYAIDIDLQRLTSGSAITAAVVGGSLDLGKASIFGLIQAHARGIPFTIEAVSALYSSAAPTVGFVVAKTSPITSARGLNGKTIASPSLGDQISLVGSAWIDQNGGDSRTVKYVELPTSSIADAIVSGHIDGAVMINTYLEQALETGHCRMIGRPYDIIAKHFAVTLYACTQEFAAKNADVLARFRRGLLESATYALAHPSEMLPIIVEYTGISRSLVEKIPPNLGSTLSLDLVQPVIDFAARYKSIPKTFPAAEFIDPAALH
jgi:NitT/TauT family transport system substrate-binding protein